jgi:thymidylate synthase
MYQTFDSLNAVQVEVLRQLLTSGKEANPRGHKTKELTFFNFELSNPRRRLLTLNGRHWDLAVALGEFCWHLAASNDAEFVTHYAKAWAELASTDCTIPGSSYGKTIFASEDTKPSQWLMTKALLKSDQDSRRAVLFFNNAQDRLTPSVLDVACASSLQFIIRNNQLDAILTMRSNDAILGLPYDIFFFTMVQEMMAVELEIPLGRYFHAAGSMHIYHRHLRLAEATISGGAFQEPEMPSMLDVSSIPKLLEFEQLLRTSGPTQSSTRFEDRYWGELASVLRWHRARRQNASEAELRELSKGRYAALLNHMLDR